MGVREKIARANWELDCLLRTGRLPQFRSPTPYYAHSAYPTGRQMTCRTCSAPLREGGRFCDQCGAKIT